jgi:hypothetical protein
MYRISANFLDYVIEHYDPSKTLITKVNAACRQGKHAHAQGVEPGRPVEEGRNPEIQRGGL